MREGWSETNLEGIAEYINGYPFKPADLGENGVPVIRIRQLLDPNEPVDRTETETPERCLLRDGDIVFSWSGTLAVRIWNRGPAKLNQHLFRVIEKKGVYKGIIPLILDHAIEELEEKSHGTTMKHITKQTLLPHKVLLPPLPEQKRIVDLISSVDSYIESLQQQLESAKRSRNAVLHELLTAGGDGWVEMPLGSVVSIVNGGTPSTKNEDFWGGSVVWITTTELTAFDGKRVNTSKRTITADGLSNGPAKLVRAGTTLVGTTATIGTCAIADCELTFNQQISGLIPLDKNLDDNYLFYWIQHSKPILEGLAAGTSFKRISTSVLKTVSIQFPPIGDQQKIAELISQMDDFIDSIQHNSIEAKNLRSGLLSDLLSGEHEIPASYDKVIGAA
jgi:type I restriction enzyme S subunit